MFASEMSDVQLQTFSQLRCNLQKLTMARLYAGVPVNPDNENSAITDLEIQTRAFP